MKILITGLPKTGTTGLFYTIRQSLGGGEVREMFEPAAYERQESDEAQGVLAKALLAQPHPVDYESFSGFEKKIGLVRDPRDWVISSLLYAMFDAPYCEDDAATAQILAALRRKEADPHSVSVLEITRLFCNVWTPPEGMDASKLEECFVGMMINKGIREVYQWHMDWELDFYRKHPEYFIVKYEDFVSRNISALETHLGLALTGQGSVAARYQRVIRTKGAGDWRHWFIEEDIEFFKPIFSEMMNAFSYPADWAPAEQPVVLPEYSSEYVRGLIAERKAATLLKDPARAQELLQKTKKLCRTFHSRHPAETGLNQGELGKEMDDYQVAFTYLLQQAKNVDQLSRQLSATKEKLSAKTAELKAKREQLKRLERSAGGKLDRLLGKFRKKDAEASPPAGRT